jgi:hypothetical protein
MMHFCDLVLQFRAENCSFIHINLMAEVFIIYNVLRVLAINTIIALLRNMVNSG